MLVLVLMALVYMRKIQLTMVYALQVSKYWYLIDWLIDWLWVVSRSDRSLLSRRSAVLERICNNAVSGDFISLYMYMTVDPVRFSAMQSQNKYNVSCTADKVPQDYFFLLTFIVIKFIGKFSRSTYSVKRKLY